jgi:hypothetical protein
MPIANVQLPAASLSDLAVAMGLGTLLAALTGWQYLKLGRTFTNRANLAYTLPIITLTVILIISVVKESLALSLGLVGALSIVRFRTPIREPEELGYLFISIGIGIGLGAGQVLATFGATSLILVVASARKLVWGSSSRRNLYLNVDVRDTDVAGEQVFQRALDLLGPHVEQADLRRLDVGAGVLQAALYVQVADDRALANAIATLRGGLPGTVAVTFIDQENTGVSW